MGDPLPLRQGPGGALSHITAPHPGRQPGTGSHGEEEKPASKTADLRKAEEGGQTGHREAPGEPALANNYDAPTDNYSPKSSPIPPGKLLYNAVFLGEMAATYKQSRWP